MEGRTVGQWLEALAGSDSSDEQDDRKMQNLLHRVGFPRAVVTMGIVYAEGQGTINAPPAPVQTWAKALVKEYHSAGLVV